MKGSCYVSDCGPIVQTGFHLNQYYVCQKCKQEITEPLYRAIKESESRRERRDAPKKYTDDEIELMACGYAPPDLNDYIGHI